MLGLHRCRPLFRRFPGADVRPVVVREFPGIGRGMVLRVMRRIGVDKIIRRQLRRLQVRAHILIVLLMGHVAEWLAGSRIGTGGGEVGGEGARGQLRADPGEGHYPLWWSWRRWPAYPGEMLREVIIATIQDPVLADVPAGEGHHVRVRPVVIVVAAA